MIRLFEAIHLKNKALTGYIAAKIFEGEMAFKYREI